MLFVDAPEHVGRWWAEHLGSGSTLVDEGGLWCYTHEGVEVSFHPADPVANPHGASTVVYWKVGNLQQARRRLLGAGCTPHRGPLEIGTQRQICQLTDPFGNVFGLDGP